jgi:hypothetical protein
MVCAAPHLLVLEYQEGPGGGVVTLFLIDYSLMRQIELRLVGAARLQPWLGFPNHTAVLSFEDRV